MTIVYLGTMHCDFTDQKTGERINGYKLFYAIDELDYKNWQGCVVKSSWHPLGDSMIEKIPQLVPFDRYVPTFAFGGKRILSLDPAY